VELSNLNRQILHWDRDISSSKVDSAAGKLGDMNKDIRVEAINDTINENNVSEIVGDCDVIIDAMDNLETRYLLNEAALKHGIPLMHGAVYGLEGRATTIIPGKTACLRCIYRGNIPKEKFPVIGTTPAVIGSIQATEAIKYITGIGKLLADRLLVYDGLNMKFSEFKLKRHPDCEHCGKP
jgi:adenylyltransferase/sulfurtransferase